MSAKINNPIPLRGGFSAEDPRLGRVPEKDEKSRRYNVADVTPTKELRNHTWHMERRRRKTQRSTSACVGFSRMHDLACGPEPLLRSDKQPFTFDDGVKFYEEARRHDQWRGEAYDGSSVLGGAKAAVALGYIGEYRWAFTIDDMLAALAWIGPVVVGTIWYNSMFDPHLPTGEMIVDSRSGDAGGHAYMLRGLTVTESAKIRIVGRERNRPGIPLMRVTNSWWEEGQPMWGVYGEAFMWADDYERYLMPGGEQCITTQAFRR